MSDDLVAPEASLRTMEAAGIPPHQATAIRIAAPIVAAELREWAEDIDNDCWSIDALPAVMRRRADELDGRPPMREETP